MLLVICFLVGVVVGGICIFLYAAERHRKATVTAAAADALMKRGREAYEALKAREQKAEQRAAELEAYHRQLDKQAVSYRELQDENVVLKRDLRNMELHVRKTELDHQELADRQSELDQRGSALAERYLSETVKQIVAAVGPNNFASCKARLLDVIERCREIGYAITQTEEERLLAQLRTDFEEAVRTAFEREEQARIRAQIREEERIKREVDRELKQLDRERLAIQAALDQALAAAKDKHSEEIQILEKKLAEAEARSQRALSMAQQTKAGNVYVISNIGSFGEGVFKVGMTRRLEPMDRVRELGDASVPFPFDVHMMIASTDAPALENAIHRALHRLRLNRVNPRKEFFKADIEMIRKIVVEHHGEVKYLADPAALEYRQSLTISTEDAEYVERVYEEAQENTPAGADAED